VRIASSTSETASHAPRASRYRSCAKRWSEKRSALPERSEIRPRHNIPSARVTLRLLPSQVLVLSTCCVFLHQPKLAQLNQQVATLRQSLHQAGLQYQQIQQALERVKQVRATSSAVQNCGFASSLTSLRTVCLEVAVSKTRRKRMQSLSCFLLVAAYSLNRYWRELSVRMLV